VAICDNNLAENRPVNIHFLNEIPQVNIIDWSTFSKQEFRDTIAKYSLLSSFELDHIFWKYLKAIFSNNHCLEKLFPS